MAGAEMSTIEIIKNLAQHVGDVVIEFTNAETRDKGEPIFEVSIKDTKWKEEGTFDVAVNKLNDAVDRYCEWLHDDDEAAEQVAEHRPETAR